MQNVMHIATNSGHTAQNDGRAMQNEPFPIWWVRFIFVIMFDLHKKKSF